MSFKHGMFVPVVSVLGTLINYDDDDNNAKAKKNKTKKIIGCMRKTIALHDAF